jgi:hypothetical protein
MSTIPQAVLALIGSGPWSYPGQSAVEPHEAVYIKADEPAEPFTFAEVEELHHQGVFGNQSQLLDGKRIAVREGALSVLDTFLADVHGDWLVFRERLEAVSNLHGPLAVAQVAKLPIDDRPMLEQLRAKYDGDKNGWQPRAESDL